MSDIFISHARSTAEQARQVAEALRGLGHGVWLDDELPAHRAYTDVIEERLKAAKAVLVIWSAEAVKSQWVRAEAEVARERGTLVQLSIDGAVPPLPFNQIQCADMNGWGGDLETPGWRKVVGSIAQLTAGTTAPASEGEAAPPLTLPSKPSIAVLPFANLSGDPDQAYFTDGMVEEIITALSRIKSIFVIGPGSSRSFKGTAVGPEDAARRLGVRFVLEGSVRNAGGRVRISVKLTDAVDGAQIWADRFDDTLEDVFALQDRVALAVAGKIEPTVLLLEMRRAANRPTENMGSYDLYLRAWGQLRGNATADTRAALVLLERAIELDPEFGLALGLAAIAHGIIYIDAASTEAQTRRGEAIDLAHRALRVAGDDALVVSYAAGAMWMVGEDSETTFSLIERAIAMNPGLYLAWHWSGVMRVGQGDARRGAEDISTSMRLDPLSPLRGDQLMVLGLAHLLEQRFDQAVALFGQGMQLSPRWAYGYYFLGACQGHLGQTMAARESMVRARSLSNRPTEEFAAVWLRRAEDQRLVLAGIALAGGGGAAGQT